jgi:DNA invertase Pin-like site-specific DNA recombinase
LRYSTAEQGKGDSGRRQGDWFEAVCAKEGWQIDTSFPLEDKGKSAYKGDHLKADLGRFLQAVNSGRIPRGSVLLVEELDRLSRQERKKALPLVMGLLTAGIDIRTRDRHYTEDSLEDLGSFIDITIRQGTANDESRKKSMRCREVWAAWRERIAAGERVPPPGKMPVWVRWNGERFELVEEMAASVRLIFDLAGRGLGTRRILARLNGEEEGTQPVPVIGRRSAWRLSTLGKILRGQSVLGHFQDPTGAVYEGVYPAVVSKGQYIRAREALVAKRMGTKGVGRLGAGVPNLFSGLLIDARDGSTLHLIDKGTKGGGKFLVSSAALRHEPGAVAVPFSYPVFEAAVVKLLREIKAREVLGQPDAPDEVMVLAGKLRTVEDAIAALTKDLDEHGESPALFARLRQREGQRTQVAEQLAAARARAAHPLSETWGDLKAVLKALDDPEVRLRFRTCLRRLVEEVRVLVVRLGRQDRLAAVQLFFKDSPTRRAYGIRTHTHCGSGQHRRPVRSSLRSLAEVVGAGDIDLRRPADVAELEAILPGGDFSEKKA